MIRRKPWHEMIRTNHEIERLYGVTMLPCPFCRSPNVGLHMGPTSHVECMACDAGGPSFERGGRDQLDYNRVKAIGEWNAARRLPEIEPKSA